MIPEKTVLKQLSVHFACMLVFIIENECH